MFRAIFHVVLLFFWATACLGDTVLLYQAGRAADQVAAEEFSNSLNQHAINGGPQISVVTIPNEPFAGHNIEGFRSAMEANAGDIDALILMETGIHPFDGFKSVLDDVGISDKPILRIGSGQSPDLVGEDNAHFISLLPSFDWTQFDGLPAESQSRIHFWDVCDPPFNTYVKDTHVVFDVCWIDPAWVDGIEEHEMPEDLIPHISREAGRIVSDCLMNGDLDTCTESSLWNAIPYDVSSNSWTMEPKIRTNWDLLQSSPKALGLSEDQNETALEFINRVVCPDCAGSGDICGGTCPSECKNTCSKQGEKECCRADGLILQR